MSLTYHADAAGAAIIWTFYGIRKGLSALGAVLLSALLFCLIEGAIFFL